jgi:hypothetical protein
VTGLSWGMGRVTDGENSGEGESEWDYGRVERSMGGSSHINPFSFMGKVIGGVQSLSVWVWI